MITLDHDAARQLMADAVGGRLSGDDERELAVHLVSCDDCKAIYDGLQQAHPAFGAIHVPAPSTDAIDQTIHRATTVLRGEADPGPVPRAPVPEPAPPLADDAVSSVATSDTGPIGEEPTPRPDPAAGAQPVPPPDPDGPIGAQPPPEPGPTTSPPPLEPNPQRPAEPLPADEPTPPPSRPEWVYERDPQVEPPPLVIPPQPAGSSGVGPPLGAEPAASSSGEIDELFGHEHYGDIDEARQEREPREGVGPAWWLGAIAIAVVLAVLAGMLIVRGQSIFGGGGDLPAADELQGRVARTFIDMNSLKADFEIQRLGLYRVGSEDDSLVYSFSNGTYDGRIVYDRAEGYRQEHTLTVRGEDVERVQTVQTNDESQTLIGAGADAELLVEADPPLGPPDGASRSRLGLLEESLASAARMVANASDLEVIGRASRDGRDTFEVRFDVEADALSRADEIEAAIDANSYLPVVVQRSISRDNARVLGPESALSDGSLDTAFGDLERVNTEIVQLSNVNYDDIVLPGDYVLDVPDGVTEQQRSAGFTRVPGTEAASLLGYDPLSPTDLPDGFEERTIGVVAGEGAQSPWGPGGAYPAPDGVMHASYFDGMTTIVVTQRRMTETFDIEGSPLQGGGLPIAIETVSRDEKTFAYGTSPEVVPHLFGFLGNTFVMVSGYASPDLLADVAASLSEEAAATAEPLDVSPSPSPVDGSPAPVLPDE